MSTPEKVERAGHAANTAARKRLQEEYPERWEALLSEERKNRGLFPATKRRTIAELESEKEELETENARLRAIAAQHGIEV